jgi:hypothetical protein
MTEAIRRAKPFAWGIAAGILLTVIVGFSTGWVVTAVAKERAIWTAKVDRLAVICATESTSQWQAEGKDSAALHGWRLELRDRPLTHACEPRHLALGEPAA